MRYRFHLFFFEASTKQSLFLSVGSNLLVIVNACLQMNALREEKP